MILQVFYYLFSNESKSYFKEKITYYYLAAAIKFKAEPALNHSI